MAENQEFKQRRVNSIPTVGLVAGDMYALNVGGGKYKNIIISDSLQPTIISGTDFLEKDSMAELRSISSREIWAIQNGYYKGVKLNGYYFKGDTPAPIEYYISNTQEEDDNGSIIKIISEIPITFIHNFKGQVIDIRYFGVIPNTTDDFSSRIQRAFFLGQNAEKVFIPKGEYNIKTVGSTDNKQFLFDNGGLKVYSNTNIEFEKGAVFNAISTNFTAYNILRLWNVSNVKINNATLIGDRYKHIAQDNLFYLDYEPSKTYQSGNYVFWHNYGLRVISGGTTSNTAPDFSNVSVGSSIVNGSVTFNVISIQVGEWGYGIFIGGCSNIEIDNANISNMWGDGIDLNYANEATLISNVNIRLSNINSRNNRRQGMSIETGKGIYIDSSSFTETNGASPQSGIDIEPWNESAICEDIYINNCFFKNNRANAINVNFPTLKNVNITNNRFECDPGLTNTHIYHTYGGGENNEVKIIGNDFDGNADNILTNAGFAIVSNNLFRSQIKLTTVGDWIARDYIIINNTFKGELAQVFQEYGDTTKTIIKDNIFYESYVNILRGKSDIKGNIFKGGNNTAVQIYPNASDVLVDGNTFDSKFSCVTTRKNVEFINNIVKNCEQLMYIISNINNYVRVCDNYILNNASVTCINADNINNIRNSYFSGNTIISNTSLKPDLVSQFRVLTDSIAKNNHYIVNGVAMTDNSTTLPIGLKLGQQVFFWGSMTKTTITAVAEDGSYTFAPILTQAEYLDPTTATTAQIVQFLQAANIIKPTI